MTVADGLVPNRRQAICNNHADSIEISYPKHHRKACNYNAKTETTGYLKCIVVSDQNDILE